jgi:hypothetical protein
MKMGKFLFLIIFMPALSAQAKTYFDQSSNRAMVYYSQGDAVNASLCNNVSEVELQNSLDDTLKKKCKPLSKNGISMRSIEAQLPQIKKDALAAIDALGKQMGGIADMANDADASKDMSGMMNALLEPQREQVRNITAAQLFGAYQIEARNPILEEKSAADLDKEITDFVSISK